MKCIWTSVKKLECIILIQLIIFQKKFYLNKLFVMHMNISQKLSACLPFQLQIVWNYAKKLVENTIKCHMIQVFAWGSDSYWPVWVCQLASALQLFPILLVPLIGLIQTCRYLAATDDDLFEVCVPNFECGFHIFCKI